MATPRRIYRRLNGGSLVVTVTYGFAFVAWVVMIGHTVVPHAFRVALGGSHLMTGAPGAPESAALAHGLGGVALYLVLWCGMVVAMMFPSAATTFGRFAASVRDGTRSGRFLAVSAFVLVYTAVWTVLGLVPLGVQAAVPIASFGIDSGSVGLGLAFLLLGGYQLSPQKAHCLRHCRSPATLVTASSRPVGTARMAFRTSLYDVGACWPLMGLMVVAGSMNVPWMAVITVVLTLEQLAPWGALVTLTTGLVVAGSGVVVLGAALL